MASGFNTSTRKEDISVRLKSQHLNPRQSKQITQQLEVESRKMEERLQELKLAMSKEKEERQRQGGGFWKSGQEGQLANHAQVVLMKPPEKPRGEKKTRKIKVLKDEPLDKPMRSKQPGTMAHIANQKVAKDNVKISGPRCGQCEQKAAAVTCLECGEDYCAGCFASFHLKGALRKHRSVPLQMNGPRQFISPRKDSSISNGEGIVNGVGDNHNDVKNNNQPPVNHKESRIITNHSKAEERSSPIGASRSIEANTDGGALWGAYEEEESAASFQNALRAWRCGDSPSEDKVTKKKNVINPQVVSPVKTPTVQMEMGTETTDNMDKQLMEIHFENFSVSYADKLLLKQHRRTDIGEFPSPRHIEAGHPTRQNMNERNSIDEEEKVNFQTLFESVVQSPRVETYQRPQSILEVIDLSDAGSESSSLDVIEQSSYYQVQEDDDIIQDVGMRPQAEQQITMKPVISDQDTVSPGATGDGSQTEYNTPPVKSRMSSRPQSRPQSNTSNKNKENKPMQKKVEREQKRPLSHKETIRAKSRKSDRPLSRAKSRAASRIAQFGEGVLTKAPSEHLKIVASLSSHIEPVCYTPVLGDFLTVGVKTVQEDRVMTPSSHAKRPTSSKALHQLCATGPRSWRPHKSLGDTVPDTEVKAFFDTVDMRPFSTTEDCIGAPHVETVSFSLSGHSTPEPYNTNHSTSSDRVPVPSASEASNKLQDNRATNTASPSKTGSKPKPKLFTIDLSRPVSRIKTDMCPPSISKTANDSQRPSTASGRISQAIVIDGDDFSGYDVDKEQQKEMNNADEETLGQLEWELASHDGRISADGNISRMSMLLDDDDEDENNTILLDDGRGTGLTTPSPALLEIHNGITAEELMGDFEEMEELIMSTEVADEVKALQ